MLRKECATSYGGVEGGSKQRRGDEGRSVLCLDASLVPGGQRASIPASNRVALPASVFTPPCPYLLCIRCAVR